MKATRAPTATGRRPRRRRGAEEPTLRRPDSPVRSRAAVAARPSRERPARSRSAFAAPEPREPLLAPRAAWVGASRRRAAALSARLCRRPRRPEPDASASDDAAGAGGAGAVRRRCPRAGPRFRRPARDRIRASPGPAPGRRPRASAGSGRIGAGRLRVDEASAEDRSEPGPARGLARMPGSKGSSPAPGRRRPATPTARPAAPVPAPPRGRPPSPGASPGSSRAPPRTPRRLRPAGRRGRPWRTAAGSAGGPRAAPRRSPP
jgi:hypothetical protein